MGDAQEQTKGTIAANSRCILEIGKSDSQGDWKMIDVDPVGFTLGQRNRLMGDFFLSDCTVNLYDFATRDVTAKNYLRPSPSSTATW